MYKVILMDVEMPIKNGIQATKELIEMNQTGQITNLCPILAHTAFTGE